MVNRWSSSARIGAVGGLVSMVALALTLLAWSAAPAAAQASTCRPAASVKLGGARADLARAAALLGTAWSGFGLERRASSYRAACVAPEDGALQVRPLPLWLHGAHNSAYPRERNNGALWEGRGLSGELGGGVEARWWRLTAAIEPRLLHQQNVEFAIMATERAGYSPFANPRITNIDWPQRPGDSSLTRLHLGDSYLRLDTRYVAAGVSTENIWWGPTQVWPLLLSSTAAGFPHAFLTTPGPLDIWVGAVGASAFWGRLDESEYWDGDPENDARAFSGVLLTFTPRGFPALSLGATQAVHGEIPPEGRSIGSYLGSIFGSPIFTSANEEFSSNSLGGLYIRLAPPGSGVEAYAEWMREDRPYDFKDFLFEPDWTQAYALGFNAAIASGDRMVRLYGELVHLGESEVVRAGKGFFSFYTHGGVPQGHTNQGQLLGAAVGPGSQAQLVGADLIAPWGMLGGYLERARYDDDTYYRQWARYYGESRHDVEATGGLRALYFLPRGVEVEGGIAMSRRWNRMFSGLEDREGGERIEDNIRVELGIRWVPEAMEGDRWGR